MNGGSCIEDRGWKIVEEGSWMEDRGWRIVDGGSWMENRGWRIVDASRDNAEALRKNASTKRIRFVIQL